MGGTVDRACKLEAMLCSLSNRRKALRFEQSKIDNQFIRLMNELQHSLKNDEDLTVILADTFSLPVESAKADFASTEKTKDESSGPDERSVYPRKPLLQRAATPPMESSRAGRFACFAGGVFGDDSGTREQASDLLRSSLTSEFSLIRGSQDSDPDADRLFTTSAHPSPSAMRAGAQAWREQHGRDAATSANNSIDFRTGMSGHMALLSTHAHAHEYLEPTWLTSRSRQGASRTSSSRMSAHTGLTMPKMPTLQGILNSLTLPAMTTTKEPRREGSGQIKQSGSM